ncbi:MAG TPA: hypothetical protein VLB29_01510 [Nocardioidaceae bacterium]|nr:hypothetical protein [Nocardioidaceae bacterium]
MADHLAPDHEHDASAHETADALGSLPERTGNRWRFSSAVEAARHIGTARR